jgi:hypothetical protein
MEGNQYKVIDMRETTLNDPEITYIYKKENIKMFD